MIPISIGDKVYLKSQPTEQLDVRSVEDDLIGVTLDGVSTWFYRREQLVAILRDVKITAQFNGGGFVSSVPHALEPFGYEYVALRKIRTDV